MPLSAAFIESMTEQLASLGRITVRKMFGGAAMYADGQVFALLNDDVVYFKVDDTTRPNFEAEACGPFIYKTSYGVNAMNAYHRAPDRLMDEPDELLTWARAAVAAGQRATLKKRPMGKSAGATKPRPAKSKR